MECGEVLSPVAEQDGIEDPANGLVDLAYAVFD